MIGHKQSVLTEFVLLSRNLNNISKQLFLSQTSKFVSPGDGVSFEKPQAASYLLDLSRYLHRTQNYLVSSHVLL